MVDWSFARVDSIMDEVIFDEQQIKRRVSELGTEITDKYNGEPLLIIGVLRGAFIFMADLIRSIDLPIAVDFMLVSSYGERKNSSGVVRIVKDTKENIFDRHVLIVEDIVDTGYTYNSLKKTLQTREPASLRVCSLLNKKINRKVEVDVDFYGFESPDEFLVGYGLDYLEYHRECPFIFKPTEEALNQLEE
ncbi:MAG: hypoxanthine phosphoribosyltransferase [bacterium]